MAGDIKVAILGIGNHRVPNYELPSNIPGLTFTDPIAKAQELSTLLRPTNDVVIALTHIGFTENPASVEVDTNVDTNLAANVTGLDAIIGGHSHTNPATGFGAYKYLPASLSTRMDKPGDHQPGLPLQQHPGRGRPRSAPQGGGGYEVVSRDRAVISACPSARSEDAAIKAIVDPYVDAAGRLQQHRHRPDHRSHRHPAGLHPGDQRCQPAGGCLRLRAGSKNGITVDFHLSGAMTNKTDRRLLPLPLPRHPEGPDMFTADALRELAGGA